ncbi:MAG TPA: DUF222 domain-containing protein [Streptosporangiaceae bacterium]|nr:DUF222 domain-containing protein [Streptosporangiaceae bacterium]
MTGPRGSGTTTVPESQGSYRQTGPGPRTSACGGRQAQRFPPAGPVRPVTLIHLGRTTRCNRAAVAAVLDALAAPAGNEDDRTKGQRYHDALAEAMRQLGKCIVTCITQCDTRTVGTA